jgi:hypothetical protein
MSDQFFYFQFKFTPKIGHTFANERKVLVEVPKNLIQQKAKPGDASLITSVLPEVRL